MFMHITDRAVTQIGDMQTFRGVFIYNFTLPSSNSNLKQYKRSAQGFFQQHCPE